MTVNNAVKGLKNIIRLREELIKDLDTMTKDSKDECMTRMIEALSDFMTRDIGSFEGILGDIQRKKTTRVFHDNKKRK
ncbi:MAG: hypothetical protein WAL88_01610 [Nitrosotalea sp.]